jgi:hypothetical protein
MGIKLSKEHHSLISLINFAAFVITMFEKTYSLFLELYKVFPKIVNILNYTECILWS